MSKYKGQHGGKKGSKNSGRGLPPPLFGQCPRENIFFTGWLPLDSFASNTLTQSVILYLNWNFYNTIDFIVFQDFF